MCEFVGIDTSNYTTSCAVSESGVITVNERKLLEVAVGERGLRQSDAVFQHVRNLPEVIKKVGRREISAVGVSDRPRNVAGSYMPCFLAGVSVAESLASLCGVRLFRFSHQQGHIAAALYSAGCEYLHGGEFLAFHLSGGTTELLHVNGNDCEIIGRTLDISCGQLIDRAGVMLGLKFPCGGELEKLAGNTLSKKVRTSVRGLDCCLSGFENKVGELIKKGAGKCEISNFVLSAVAETVSAMTENALEQYGRLPVVYSGGVVCNNLIKERLGEYGGLFAGREFASDNAAGIARLTEMTYLGELDYAE